MTAAGPQLCGGWAPGRASECEAEDRRGNRDPTGRHFFFERNLGGSRMDASIVKIPSQLLTGSASTTAAPSVAITSPSLREQRVRDRLGEGRRESCQRNPECAVPGEWQECEFLRKHCAVHLHAQCKRSVTRGVHPDCGRDEFRDLTTASSSFAVNVQPPSRSGSTGSPPPGALPPRRPARRAARRRLW